MAENDANAFTTAQEWAPTGLDATQSGGAVNLTWTAPAGGWAGSYDVYRASTSGGGTDCTSYTKITGSPVVPTSYSDSTVVNGTTYYYVVEAIRASDSKSSTICSNELSITADSSPPTIKTFNPKQGATNVGANRKIQIVFSEAMNTAATEGATTVKPCTAGGASCTSQGSAVGGTFVWTGNDRVLKFTPTSALTANTYYITTVTIAAQDANGAALASQQTAIWRTGNGPDTTYPQLLSPTYPVNSILNIPTDAQIILPFSEPMEQSTVEASGTVTVCKTPPTGCLSAGSLVFSWNGEGTDVTITHPTEAMDASTQYTVTVLGAAKDLSDNRLAGVASDSTTAATFSFTTSGATDTIAPLVIPPTVPASGATGVARNTSIVLTYSEPMDQSATEGAFSCSPSCGTVSFGWNAIGTIATVDSTSDLAASTSYTVTISTAAIDVIGNALSAQHQWTFTTGAGTDTTAPSVPTILTPASEAWSTATTYTITGSNAEADLLVELWRDVDNSDTLDTSTDELIESVQLGSGATLWSFTVALLPSGGMAGAGKNDFLARVQDAAGNYSSEAAVPRIHQDDIETTAETIVVTAGSDDITAEAPFQGDSDADNSGTMEWRTTTGDCATGTYGSSSAMTRSADKLSHTETGLSSSTSYDVRVTYSDPDGVNGTSQQCATATTETGIFSTLLNNVTASAAFASRAGQTGRISADVTGASGRFEIDTSPQLVTSCDDGPPGTMTYDWDETDDGGSPEVDGTYNFRALAYLLFLCIGVGDILTQAGGLGISVSNAASVSMFPPPASVVLYPGEYVEVVATVTNHLNELVPDDSGGGGATVTWSASGNVSGNMDSDLSRTSSVVGTSYGGECSVTASSGQACTRLTIPAGSKTVQSVTVTASINSQDPGTTTLIAKTGTTMISDPPPPAPPSGLQLSVGSLQLAWNPSPDWRTVGYKVFIGTHSGQYDTIVDIGTATSYRHVEVEPGQTYYVVVRAYDRMGQLSVPTVEGSLTTPPVVEIPAVEVSTTGAGTGASVAAVGTGGVAISAAVDPVSTAGAASASVVAPTSAAGTATPGIVTPATAGTGTEQSTIKTAVSTGGAVVEATTAPEDKSGASTGDSDEPPGGNATGVDMAITVGTDIGSAAASTDSGAGSVNTVAPPGTSSSGTGTVVSPTTTAGAGTEPVMPSITTAGAGSDTTVPPSGTSGAGTGGVVPTTGTGGTGSDGIIPAVSTAGTGSDPVVPPVSTTGSGSSSTVPPTGTAGAGTGNVVPPPSTAGAGTDTMVSPVVTSGAGGAGIVPPVGTGGSGSTGTVPPASTGGTVTDPVLPPTSTAGAGTDPFVPPVATVGAGSDAVVPTTGTGGAGISTGVSRVSTSGGGSESTLPPSGTSGTGTGAVVPATGTSGAGSPSSGSPVTTSGAAAAGVQLAVQVGVGNGADPPGNPAAPPAPADQQEVTDTPSPGPAPPSARAAAELASANMTTTGGAAAEPAAAVSQTGPDAGQDSVAT